MKETNGSTIIYHYLIGFLYNIFFSQFPSGRERRYDSAEKKQNKQKQLERSINFTFCRRSNFVSMWQQHTHTHNRQQTSENVSEKVPGKKRRRNGAREKKQCCFLLHNTKAFGV